MSDKELVVSLSKDFVKHTDVIEKLKKENLEFYNQIQSLKGKLVKAESQLQAYQKMFLLEKDSKGEWIVLWVGYAIERQGGGRGYSSKS